MRNFFLLAVLVTALVGATSTTMAQEAQTYESFSGIDWVYLPVFEAGRGVTYVIDGESWGLPLETYMAHTTQHGRFSSIVPQESSPDLGYCQTGQRDCTNHALLWRVAVPREVAAETVAYMDVAHRVFIQTSYAEPIPVLIGLRWNLAEITGDFPVDDGKNHWGLTSEELAKAFDDLNLGNPALMISAIEPVDGVMFFSQDLGEAVPVGYSCWDCLADTSGVDALAVPLVDVDHNGPSVAPLGETELPGLSLNLPNPDESLEWIMQQVVVTAPTPSDQLTQSGLAVWVGEFRPELLSPQTLSAQGGGGEEETIGEVQIVAERLNVRSAPTLTAPIVDTVEAGLIAEVFEVSEDFVRIGPGRWISISEGHSRFTPVTAFQATPTPEALG